LGNQSVMTWPPRGGLSFLIHGVLMVSTLAQERHHRHRGYARSTEPGLRVQPCLPQRIPNSPTGSVTD